MQASNKKITTHIVKNNNIQQHNYITYCKLCQSYSHYLHNLCKRRVKRCKQFTQRIVK